MVEALQEGDGIRRDVIYGKWRTDKKPSPGFSAELVNIETPESCYDDFNKLDVLDNPVKSILEVFINQVRDRPNHNFLGTRAKNSDGSFGSYIWMTYRDVFIAYEEIAKGMKALRLAEPVPGINEDGKQWSFCGIWS